MALERQRLNLQVLEAEEQELKTEEQELEQRSKELECEKSALQNRLKRKRDEINEQNKRIKLEELCDSLRRNDESLAENPTQELEKVYALPAGYAKSFGEALLENTNVATISIFPGMLVPIDFLNDRLDSDCCKALLAHVEPLVHYVKSSSSLRQVLFQEFPFQCHAPSSGHHVETRLSAAFFEAVRENLNVDSVTISYPICLSTLSPSLLSGMSLKTLNIGLDHFNGSLTTDEVVFASSFESMTTLQHLTLSELYKNERLAESILARLASGCASLQELKLAGHWYAARPYSTTKELWMTLAQVFYSATMLQHLELDGFNLNRADMDGLVTCLKLPDNSSPSPSTISKLSFRNCTYEAGSDQTLIAFLRTRTSIEEGKAHGSSLRELYGFEPSKGLVTVLASSDGATTIGSQLQTVSFNEFPPDHVDEFIRVSKWIHLRCLHLYRMDGASCRKLRRCLPRISPIRELHVSLELSSGMTEGREMLYAMVRQSESLCVFSAKDWLDLQLFSETQCRHLDAYCQRNQFLIQLTTGRRWDDDRDEQVERAPIVLSALHFPLVARTAMRLSRGKLLGVISCHDRSSG